MGDQENAAVEAPEKVKDATDATKDSEPRRPSMVVEGNFFKYNIFAEDDSGGSKSSQARSATVQLEPPKLKVQAHQADDVGASSDGPDAVRNSKDASSVAPPAAAAAAALVGVPAPSDAGTADGIAAAHLVTESL